MGLSMAQNLSNEAALGPDLWKPYIWNLGWIYAIRTYIALSRPVVEQHHCHFIFTSDFQCQIKNILYLRNGRVDWHGTKGMWANRMSHSICDFQLWSQPWPRPWIFKVKFWICCISGKRGSTHLEERDVSWIWWWMQNGIDLGPLCRANRSAK